MRTLYAYLLLINAAGFGFMLVDKENAMEGMRRIPERVLFTIAAIGGSFGSLVAMYLLRHKTKHLNFTLGLPAIFAVHIILAVLFVNFVMK